jgi:hypothetical protein
MNSWLTGLVSLRDELFSSHPAFYSLIIVLLGVALLRYVWAYEMRILKEKRKEQYRPFK